MQDDNTLAHIRASGQPLLQTLHDSTASHATSLQRSVSSQVISTKCQQVQACMLISMPACGTARYMQETWDRPSVQHTPHA
jgi:hypothetical protein